MFDNIKNFWNDLDVTVKVNKRELVLELAVCALSGLVVGMFVSPRKQVTIGSNNGGNVVDNRTASDEEAEEEIEN